MYNIPSDDVSSGVKKRIADIGTISGVYGLDIYEDKIVWATGSGNGYSNVYFYDISSGQTTPIIMASDTYVTSRTSPAIYENKIVYHCANGNGIRNICLYDISTKEETITDFNLSRWSNGFLDIYENKIIGLLSGNIFWYDYSTGENRFFAGSLNDYSLNFAPMISLSGDKIVWLGYFDGKYKIYSYDIATGEKFLITDEENIVYPTPIAADQDNIVWIDTKDGSQNIYRYKYFPTQVSPVLYQQSEKSAGSSCFFNKLPYCSGYQVLGKGLSGKLKSITVSALIGSGSTSFGAYLYDYTANKQYSAGYYSNYYEHRDNPGWLGNPATGAQTDYTFEFQDEPVLDPTHSYQIRFAYGSSNSGLQIFGSDNSDSYPKGSWYNYDTEGIKNAYFILNIAEPPPPEKWSFGIITDLHIGRGYPDYGGVGFEDDGEGEDYYLTERLRNVVNWVNENKNEVDCGETKCGIKFLAVLGDIADTGEKSEFLKAKEILDGLNDPNKDGDFSDGIPYAVVFGNHDVWPHTEDGKADYSQGEDFFDEIFWNENSANVKLLKERLNFQRDEAHSKYKNFAFNYDGMNFIGLDFIEREGVTKGSGAIINETENWLKGKLNEYQGKEPVILFSHHPLAEPYSRFIGKIIPAVSPINNFTFEEIKELKKIIEDYEKIAEGTQILGSFAGHIHGYYPQEILGFDVPRFNLFMDANWEYPLINATPALTTEALMVGSNREDEYLKEQDKGIIKIVKVLDESEIDYKTNEGKYKPETGKGKEFIALNPYISWAYKFLEGSSNPCVVLKSHPFTNRDISSYQWQFGDGKIGNGGIIPLYCYSRHGVYNVTSTLTDAETGAKEETTRRVEIKEGLVSKIIKIKNEMAANAEIISQNIEEDLLTFGNYLIKGTDTLLLKIKHSPARPVAEIKVDFDAAEGDINLSEMIFDTDVSKKKSILYMPEWPKVVDEGKILFIPK